MHPPHVSHIPSPALFLPPPPLPLPPLPARPHSCAFHPTDSLLHSSRGKSQHRGEGLTSPCGLMSALLSPSTKTSGWPLTCQALANTSQAWLGANAKGHLAWWAEASVALLVGWGNCVLKKVSPFTTFSTVSRSGIHTVSTFLVSHTLYDSRSNLN